MFGYTRTCIELFIFNLVIKFHITKVIRLKKENIGTYLMRGYNWIFITSEQIT